MQVFLCFGKVDFQNFPHIFEFRDAITQTPLIPQLLGLHQQENIIKRMVTSRHAQLCCNEPSDISAEQNRVGNFSGVGVVDRQESNMHRVPGLAQKLKEDLAGMRPATDPGRIAGLVGGVGHSDGLHAYPACKGADLETDHGAAIGGGAFGEDEELTVPLPPFGFGTF